MRNEEVSGSMARQERDAPLLPVKTDLEMLGGAGINEEFHRLPPITRPDARRNHRRPPRTNHLVGKHDRPHGDACALQNDFHVLGHRHLHGEGVFLDALRSSAAGKLWSRDFQLPADGARRCFFDFTMPRDAGQPAVGGIEPNAVSASLTVENAPVPPQMLLQIRAFHESYTSVNSIGSRTACRESSFSANSRWHSSTSFNASSKLTLASSRVSPWEIAAGISSTKQVYPPSAAGSKTAVNLIPSVCTLSTAWQGRSSEEARDAALVEFEISNLQSEITSPLSEPHSPMDESAGTLRPPCAPSRQVRPAHPKAPILHHSTPLPQRSITPLLQHSTPRSAKPVARAIANRKSKIANSQKSLKRFPKSSVFPPVNELRPNVPAFISAGERFPA